MSPARRRAAAHQHPAQTDFAAALLSGAAPGSSSDATTAASVNEPSEAETSPAVPPAAVAAFPSAITGLAPVYAVKLVQVDWLALRGERRKIRSPADAAKLIARHLEGADREHFAVLLLDVKGQLIGVTTVSVGILSSALVCPREVFKPALLANAASVLLAHNHPSGDPQPSGEDMTVTRRLSEAGEILGIEVLDHVVIGDNGRFVSLKEKGMMAESRTGWAP